MADRLLLHIGSSIALYCSLVGMRSCDQHMTHGTSVDEYAVFHPYIALWIIGINIGVYALVNLSRKYNWS